MSDPTPEEIATLVERAKECAGQAKNTMYETVVFRFDDAASRWAFFGKYFPGNPFQGELMPGVRVTAMSLADVVTESEVYEEALEAIADGDGDAWEIATEALYKAATQRRAEIAQGMEARQGRDPASGLDAQRDSSVGNADAPKSTAEPLP